jgi:hypothetical protein
VISTGVSRNQTNVTTREYASPVLVAKAIVSSSGGVTPQLNQTLPISTRRGAERSVELYKPLASAMMLKIATASKVAVAVRTSIRVVSKRRNIAIR